MGSLIPIMALSPAFGFLAYLFIDVAVIAGIPLFSALFILVAISMPVHYLYHFSSFARNDPDRLQSEHYRIEMRQLQMQLLIGKDIPEPLPADVLDDPTPNPLTSDAESSNDDTLSALQPEDERS